MWREGWKETGERQREKQYLAPIPCKGCWIIPNWVGCVHAQLKNGTHTQRGIYPHTWLTQKSLGTENARRYTNEVQPNPPLATFASSLGQGSIFCSFYLVNGRRGKWALNKNYRQGRSCFFRHMRAFGLEMLLFVSALDGFSMGNIFQVWKIPFL